MKTFLKTALFAAVAGGLVATAPALDARERLSGQAKLDKMLEGRVAGEPRSCISTFPTSDLTVIDHTALVYRSGSTLWVNVPASPERLNDDDVLVTRTFGSQLCRQDIVTTLDRGSGFYNGNVFLGEFVPYRKAG
ncbi:MAG: hypothetical protein ACTHKM_01895 [Tsuneonella sp.]